MVLRITLLCILYYVFPLPSQASDAVWRFTIRPVAIVTSNVIRFEDIIDVTGAMPKERFSQLRTQVLWDAPTQLGAPVIINSVVLKKKMKEVLGTDEILCIYPNTLTIQRGGAVITKAVLQLYTQQRLQPMLEREFSGKIALTDYKLPEYIFTPTIDSTIDIIPAKIQYGRMPLTIQVRSHNQRIHKNHTASVMVNVYKEVMCATETMAKNTKLDGNVQQCTKNIALLHDTVWDAKNILSYRTKRTLGKGDTITISDIERMPTVQKGSIVMLTYKSNTVQLQTKATVLTEGNIGERISVQPIESKKHIYATVVNATNVHVIK